MDPEALITKSREGFPLRRFAPTPGSMPVSGLALGSAVCLHAAGLVLALALHGTESRGVPTLALRADTGIVLDESFVREVSIDPPPETSHEVSHREERLSQRMPTDVAWPRLEPERLSVPEVEPVAYHLDGQRPFTTELDRLPLRRSAAAAHASSNATPVAPASPAPRVPTPVSRSTASTPRAAAPAAPARFGPRAIPGAQTPPTYPRRAVDSGWQGTVILKAFVAASGEVTRCQLIRSSGHGILDRAALRAVGAWRYHPATIGGRPVAGERLIKIPFRL